MCVREYTERLYSKWARVSANFQPKLPNWIKPIIFAINNTYIWYEPNIPAKMCCIVCVRGHLHAMFCVIKIQIMRDYMRFVRFGENNWTEIEGFEGPYATYIKSIKLYINLRAGNFKFDCVNIRYCANWSTRMEWEVDDKSSLQYTTHVKQCGWYADILYGFHCFYSEDHSAVYLCMYEAWNVYWSSIHKLW